MTNAELIQKIKAEIERLKAKYRKDMYKSNREGLASGYKIEAYNELLPFLDTLEESEKTISPWKKIHTYTEELHEGDMEKMLLELSVGKGEKRTKIALPDRIIDILESEKPMNQDEDLKKEIERQLAIFPYTKVTPELPESRFLVIQKELFLFARHFAEWGYLRAAEKYDEIEYNRQRAEESVPNDLEEAANEFAVFYDQGTCDGLAQDCFIAGAKWQYQKDRGKFAEIKAKTWGEGFDACKEQMLKEAVKGAVFGTVDDHWVETEIMDEKLSYVSPGDKVRVIIIKDDGKSY